MLATIFGCGFFTWVGFVYVAVRMRTKAAVISAACYCLAAVVTFLLIAVDPEAESSVGPAITMLTWAAGIVHALIIRQSWLRWRAFNDPWAVPGSVAPQPVPPGPIGQYPVPPGLPGPHRAPGATGPYRVPPPGVTRAHPPRPHAAPMPPPMPTGPHPVPPPVPPAPPVSVNTADHDALGELPWFDAERTIKVILERDRRGRFYSIEEFAAAAELTPQQLAVVRTLITL